MVEFNRRSLEEAKIKPMIFAAWDDVAGQQGMMFSPELFKKYFLPIWKELISMAKKKELYFIWHCCGNVEEILPMMIDAGIDVFDVLQTSARNMEIEKFYKRFGKRVCVHGGIDVQKILVSGTARQIKEEVKKIKDLWGNRGGIIMGPSHEIVPGTPLENVLLLYETLKG